LGEGQVSYGRGPAPYLLFSDNATDYVYDRNAEKKDEPDPKIRLCFIYPMDFGIGYVVDNILVLLFQLPEIF